MIEIWYVCRSPGLHLRYRWEIQLFGLRDQVLRGQWIGRLNEELVSGCGKGYGSPWDQNRAWGGLALQFGTAGYFPDVEAAVGFEELDTGA
jgi:hypothetical protein